MAVEHESESGSGSTIRIRGGDIITNEKAFLQAIFGSALTFEEKRNLIKSASRQQLASLLVVAFNICNHRRSHLLPEERRVLTQFYRTLLSAFYRHSSKTKLRHIFQLPTLLSVIITPIANIDHHSLVVKAIRELIFK